jgi:hypothetical protein
MVTRWTGTLAEPTFSTKSKNEVAKVGVLPKFIWWEKVGWPKVQTLANAKRLVIPRPPVLYSHSRIPIPTPDKILACTAISTIENVRFPGLCFFLDSWKEKCFYREFP